MLRRCLKTSTPRLERRQATRTTRLIYRSLATIVIASVLTIPAHAQRRLLTPALAVETARFLPISGLASADDPGAVVSISPGQSRYVFRVLRGDVERNGVWVAIWAGRLGSSAQPPQRIARLFSSGLGPGGVEFIGSRINLSPLYAEITWLDDRSISFFWEDSAAVRQVVRLDTTNGSLVYLTRSPTHVAAYGLSPTGDILYNAMARQPEQDEQMLAPNGIVISRDADAYSLFRRDLSGYTLLDRRFNTQWFFDRHGADSAQQIRVAGRDVDLNAFHRMSLSPDGQTAIVSSAPTEIPETWSVYTGSIMRSRILNARSDPREMFARLVQQLWVVDLEQGTTRPLWNAPHLAMVTKAAFSPDARRVIVAPVHLPPDSSDQRSLEGQAAAVIDVATGKYQQVPISIASTDFDVSLTWRSQTMIAVNDSTHSLRCFLEESGTWQSAPCEPTRTEVPSFEIQQDPEHPPRLFTRDRGTPVMLFDPNSDLLDEIQLGRSETISGRLDDQTEWTGIIFYPNDYVPGRRYPLVIQTTYGDLAGSQFTLYGSGGHIGPTEIATYPGRSLAARGLMVLHLNVSSGSRAETPAEPRMHMRVFEEAARKMIHDRLADPERIGIAGFSRNGWYVEYALINSDFEFAAALVADNFEPNYVQALFLGTETTNAPVVGSEPFGPGLANWLNESPGFNVERVRTPLRMVEQSFSLWGVLLRWELFSRLRHLQRPVELYMMPNPEAGDHNPQNPRQILALQEGTIDWFRFWLSDYVDSDPAKAEQYARWQILRSQRDALRDQPRPPLLEWRATPHDTGDDPQ